MNPYEVLYYLLVGALCGSIAQSIQNLLVRRRFWKLFGRNATQSEVDKNLVARAIRIDFLHREQRSYTKALFAQMGVMVDLEKESPKMKWAKTKLKSQLIGNRRWERETQKTLKEFRRAQKLAKFIGFTVRKDYTEYLPPEVWEH